MFGRVAYLYGKIHNRCQMKFSRETINLGQVSLPSEISGLYVRSTAKVIYGREKLRKKEKPGEHYENGISSCLQRLLMSGEYRELENDVLLEDQFLLLDNRGIPTRQVILGITKGDFIIVKHVILNYKDHPWIFYDTESDPYTNSMEMELIIPLRYVNFSMILGDDAEEIFEVQVQSGKRRHFILTNVGATTKERLPLWKFLISRPKCDPIFSNSFTSELLVRKESIYHEDDNVSEKPESPNNSEIQDRSENLCSRLKRIIIAQFPKNLHEEKDEGGNDEKVVQFLDIATQEDEHVGVVRKIDIGIQVNLKRKKKCRLNCCHSNTD